MQWMNSIQQMNTTTYFNLYATALYSVYLHKNFPLNSRPVFWSNISENLSEILKQQFKIILSALYFKKMFW